MKRPSLIDPGECRHMVPAAPAFPLLSLGLPRLLLVMLALTVGFFSLPAARAQSATPPTPAQVAAPATEHAGGGEANLHLPNLNSASFFHDTIGGGTLLTYGLIFCVAGAVFGLVVYVRLKNMAVH